MLYVAAYSDATSAKADFESLKSAEGDDFEIEAAVVMSRDADGKVDVLEQGDGDTGGGAVIGGSLGFVVGLFAPPLLAATAIGAGIGAVLGHLTKKHDEKELGVELDEFFPPQLVGRRRHRRGQVPRPGRGVADRGGQADQQGDRLRRRR